MIKIDLKSPWSHGFKLIMVLIVMLPSLAQGDQRESLANQPEAVFAGSSDWLIASEDAAGSEALNASQGFAGMSRLTENSDSTGNQELSDGQSPDAAVESFESELARLQKRIEQLETADKKRTDADKKKDNEEASRAKAPQDMSTDSWNVKLGGHIQMDYINWANADPAIAGTEDYFEFRRLRLVADGTGYGQLDFRLQMTLEPETVGSSAPGTVTSPDVKDAYFSTNEIPGLGRIRIGNFFVPFSLEQVTNDTNNIFMERSIPSQGIFAVDREVGIALCNCTDD